MKMKGYRYEHQLEGELYSNILFSPLVLQTSGHTSKLCVPEIPRRPDRRGGMSPGCRKHITSSLGSPHCRRVARLAVHRYSKWNEASK